MQSGIVGFSAANLRLKSHSTARKLLPNAPRHRYHCTLQQLRVRPQRGRILGPDVPERRAETLRADEKRSQDSKQPTVQSELSLTGDAQSCLQRHGRCKYAGGRVTCCGAPRAHGLLRGTSELMACRDLHQPAVAAISAACANIVVCADHGNSAFKTTRIGNLETAHLASCSMHHPFPFIPHHRHS